MNTNDSLEVKNNRAKKNDALVRDDQYEYDFCWLN